jgi:hypothetical protein
VKIYLLDPHRAKLTGTAAGPVEYFQQSSFIIRARSAEEFIYLFLCEYVWDVFLQWSHLNHSRGNPLNKATKIQEIEEHAQRIKLFPN